MALDGGQIGTWDWDLKNGAVRVGLWVGLLRPRRPWQRGARQPVRGTQRGGVGERAGARPPPRRGAPEGGARRHRRGGGGAEAGRDAGNNRAQAARVAVPPGAEDGGIGRLAGGVAHDFNNLLTVILGYAEMAAEPSTARQPGARARRRDPQAAERAAGLTRQLLGVQPPAGDRRAARGRSRTSWSPCRTCCAASSARTSSWHRHWPGPGPRPARPRQFEQVLMNLVINARDAMPNGGTLTIETRNVDSTRRRRAAQGVQPGHYVMLAVSDTGMGMTEDVSRHLFEPFFTTKPPGQGTGLGLATVYGIVKQNGGTSGSTASPAAARRSRSSCRATGEAAASIRPPSVGQRGGARDGPGRRGRADGPRHLGRVARDARLSVLQASNGEEALEVAPPTTGRIDLVVSDVVMPVMGGRPGRSGLRIERPHVKVLFVSGYTDDAIVRQGVLEPGVEFLQNRHSRATRARESCEDVKVRITMRKRLGMRGEWKSGGGRV